MSEYIDTDWLLSKIYDLVNEINDDAPTIEPKWTPVSERLPEDGMDALAWVETEFGSRIACCNYAKDTWFDAIMDVIVEPIAWMPLPEPWKGAEDEHDK